MLARETFPCKPPEDEFNIVLMNQAAGRLSEGAAPVKELLAGVVGFVSAVAKCDSCAIYLLDGDNLVLRSGIGARFDPGGQPKRVIAIRCDGWVAENRRPLLIAEQAYSDSRFMTFNESSESCSESFLSIPLVAGGRLLGVINLQNREAHHYSEKTANLIAPVTCLLGIHLDRERLEALNAELLDGLETRKLVNRAKSILQRDLNIGEEDAHRTLQRESQNRNKPLREIAQAVILMSEMRRPSPTIAIKNVEVS